MTHKEQSVTEYINLRKSQDECASYIDGYEAAEKHLTKVFGLAVMCVILFSLGALFLLGTILT